MLIEEEAGPTLLPRSSLDRQTKQSLLISSLLPSLLLPALNHHPQKSNIFLLLRLFFFWITFVLKMSSQSRITAFVLFIIELKSNYNIVWYFTFCSVYKNPFVLGIKNFNYYNIQILLF